MERYRSFPSISFTRLLLQPADAEKRYVYPLVAPPTPEKLEQDKKTIEEQFDRAFSLVEQLAKDTEELKAAEQQRTERLDTALVELESVMSELKSANRRREDDAQKIRDEVQALKDAIPKAMNNQKELTDNRLREINGELGSLKTLVTQRMSTPSTSSALRPASGNATPAARPEASGNENAAQSSDTAAEAPKSARQSSFKSMSNGNSGGKASIPAWQMAMASSNSASGSSGEGASNGASSSS